VLPRVDPATANGPVKLRVCSWPSRPGNAAPGPVPQQHLSTRHPRTRTYSRLTMRPSLRSDRLRDPQELDRSCSPERASRRQKHGSAKMKTAALLSVLVASVPVSMAQQNCVSLRGSSTCPAFSAASINTNLTGDLYVQPHVSRSTIANSHVPAPSYHS
jgi:hypothetical protein